jgi:LysR family transcriptional regulator, transcriptional activator of nhaA
MLNYNHLHYFHVAAVEGTVAAAAQRLGVTQPTVSEQIKALERTLGMTLFERTPTGLKLTEAGRLAFEHTSVMFRAGERLVESLGQAPTDIPRTLRVGIGSSVARSTAVDFFMPLLAIERCVPCIQSGDSLDLLRLLRERELDLVLSETEPPEAARQGLAISQLDRLSLIAVGQPSLATSPDWRDVGLVQYRSSSSYRWEVESFLERRGLRPRVVAEADDALFMLEAAARGGYVAFVSRSLARDALAAKRVKRLDQLETEHLGIYAVYQDGTSAELARRAVEVLVAHVQASRNE